MIKDYFTHSATERRGIAVLIGIICLLIISIFITRNVSFDSPADIQKYKKEIEEFRALVKENEASEFAQAETKSSKFDTINFFRFNPNLATTSDFVNLGFTEKQAKSIANYRSKGAKFKVKSDFKRIYGLTEDHYEHLEPFIDFPDEISSNFNNEKSLKPEIELFRFDPNLITEPELVKLGFTEKQAKVISNYRTKGGKFYKKEDFQKMFCVTPEHFQKLEPFIDISQLQAKIAAKKEVPSMASIELNIADTATLRKIPGIGEYLASEIVKYRNRLGGYSSISQLEEIKSMKPENFEKIKLFFKLDASKVQKININFCAFKDLIKHPYCDISITKQLLNYRTQNGSFKKLEQLISAKIVTEAQFKKLVPYLTL
jgi:competence protein ComEA